MREIPFENDISKSGVEYWINQARKSKDNVCYFVCNKAVDMRNGLMDWQALCGILCKKNSRFVRLSVSNECLTSVIRDHSGAIKEIGNHVGIIRSRGMYAKRFDELQDEVGGVDTYNLIIKKLRMPFL